MQASFDFRASRAAVAVSPPVRVGTVSVDRDGFPVEGANPPLLAMKTPPFSIEFSHERPADIYPSSKDFFEVEDFWEHANVFSGRSALRNLARCNLFPADDYYCRDFVIDAAFLHGKLFLQRHPDDAISQQEEGYGIVFERAMITAGHPEVHAFQEFVTCTIGEHSMLMRCETDCLEKKSMRSIGLTTKKVKRNKRGGYYDLGTANYYQEQWLQMALSGTSHLIIGARDEGPHDTASIVKLYSLTAAQAAEKGELDANKQKAVFDGLASVLSWIKACFAQAVASGRCPADKLAQAQISFCKTGGQKALTFTLLPAAKQIEFFPEQYIQAVVELSINKA